jgi:tripartite-type tricarboxylate transporter receptor subunit TctC
MHKAVLVAVLLLLSPLALAQAYPSKPIRVVVPYPPGGIDPAMRLMAPKMAEVLGQQVIVENRPGADGIIGAENVARSAPDGYSLLFAAPSTLISGLLLNRGHKLDVLRDFTGVTQLYGTIKLLVVHSSLPVDSLKELIDYAKRNPGKISYGSAGIGSTFHMDSEQFKQLTGVDMVHIPYKGTGPMTADLVAGRVEFAIIPLVNVRAHIASGKLKRLAVFEPKRDPSMPDTPTILEVVPGMTKIGGWIGLFAPAGLPRPILSRVHEATVAAMRSPEMKEYQDKNGGIITATTPEEFAAIIRSDRDRMAQLIGSIGGLKAE